MIYLDYAATTPISDDALDVFNKVASKYYGNTKSIHDLGSSADHLLEASRKQLAELINGSPKGIYFTGGGSDSNYLAIRSLLKAHDKRGKHIITTQADHSSIRNTFRALAEEGYEVEYVPVDQNGRIDIDQLSDIIREETVLAAFHHASSEIGTIQDIKTIASLLKSNDVLLHCDCVQTFGKIPIDVKELGVDSLALSSHKIYGPKGVGACYINPQTEWESLFPGTTHEHGFRPGTLNTPGIAAFAEAAKQEFDELQNQKERFELLRSRLISQLLEMNWEITIEGDSTRRLPNIIGMRIKGMEGQYVMSECNRFGVAISTGSACQVEKQEPSPTMKALERDEQQALEFVRVSLGRPTTADEIDRTVEVFQKVIKQHMEKINPEKVAT